MIELGILKGYKRLALNQNRYGYLTKKVDIAKQKENLPETLVMSSITATGDRTARYCRPNKDVEMTLTWD
jgi:hypothetical protein